VAALSKTGGSGTAREENPFRFLPAFDWRVVLPPVAIGLVLALHLILPVHEGYRLKPLNFFANFLKILLVIYGIAAIASVFSEQYGKTVLQGGFSRLCLRRAGLFLRQNRAVGGFTGEITAKAAEIITRELHIEVRE
jgi:hypothetical protein